jgi:hypothetical protein
MDADGIIQELGTKIYEAPLSGVRSEENYPDLTNPLHLATLLIDCDTEVDMNGMLGFLENSTGRHLSRTAEALRLIGAPRSAALLESIQSCMTKHGVTWEGLRGDFAGGAEYQVTSFRELHGEALDAFASEVGGLAGRFSLFNRHYALEDSYGALCRYLDNRMLELRGEIDKRTRGQPGASPDGGPAPFPGDSVANDGSPSAS